MENEKELTTAGSSPAPAQPAQPVSKVLGVVGDIQSLSVSDNELAPEYWSPESEGETKRLIYIGVRPYSCPDFQTKEPTTIEAAHFVEQIAEGRYKILVQGSKKLIGTFENANIEFGTPFEITFLGIKKNASNNNKSANWSVRKLVVDSDAKEQS